MVSKYLELCDNFYKVIFRVEDCFYKIIFAIYLNFTILFQVFKVCFLVSMLLTLKKYFTFPTKFYKNLDSIGKVAFLF